MAVYLLILGIIGCCAMTWLFPVLAWVVHSTRGSAADSSSSSKFADPQPEEFAILIPVHNDALGLETTLRGIAHNQAEMKKHYPLIQLRTIVGLDGCTDESYLCATQAQIEAVVFTEKQGKWQTLHELLTRCPSAEWIALVDAGTVWPSQFLRSLFQARTPHLMALAPSYRREGARFIERCSWHLERLLKTLENWSGGPVSVHGATVLYHRSAFEKALSLLGRTVWLNDDVVVPLALRSLFPHRAIRYMPHIYSLDYDAPNTQPTDTLPRRQRLVRGNVQWITDTFWLKSPVVALLALRRVVRMWWGYWLLSLGLGALGLSAHMVLLTPSCAMLLGAACFGCLIMSLRVLRRASSFTDSFLASLYSPLYLVARDSHSVRWK
jgi:hypothetical protein